MATESGRITHTREPVIAIRLADNSLVECVVDTGFSGALMLPTDIIASLAILIIGRETFELVSGQFLIARLALVEINWLGQMRTVRVVISDGSDLLIGTELLDGSRLVVDYVSDRVTLTNDVR